MIRNSTAYKQFFLDYLYLSDHTLSCIPDHDAAPGLLQAALEKGNCKNKNLSDDTADPGAASKSEPNVISLVSSAAKMTLRAVKETPDASTLLKSAAAALCFFLDNYEVLSTSELSPFYVLGRTPLAHHGPSPLYGTLL